MGGRVAVFGAGNMGSAAAERLSAQGFEVTIWNRSREKAEALAGRLGAKVAGTPEEAVAQAEYVVSFLADDDAVLAATSRLPRSDGLTYLEMSTITPKTARLLAAHMEVRGICFLHSPVIGGPGRVREGKVIALVSGPRVCLNRAQPVLSLLAEHVYYLGEDPALSAATKLAYNNILVSSVGAASESLALLQAYGVDPKAFLDVLSKTVFAAFADNYVKKMVAGDVKASFALKLAAKDVDYAARSLREAGIPAIIASAVVQAFTAAIALGYGDADYTSIYQMFKSLKGGKVGTGG